MVQGSGDQPVNEFRRGWRVLLLALAGAATTVSVTLLYSFGALVLPLQAAHGWGRAELQLAISALSAGVVVASQMAGWFNLRWGLRRVTLVSLVALSLSFLVLLPLKGSVWWLYLAYFGVPIAGVGATFVTWTELVNQWFERHRGFALALVLCGSGLSAALLPAALTAVIGRWGLQAAWLLMGALPLVLTWPLALAWLRTGPYAARAPASEGQLPTQPRAGVAFAEAVRTRRYWTINLGLTLVVAAVVGVVSNTVPILRDLGLSAAEASSVFGVFGLALMAGRLASGALIDRFWPPGIAAVVLSMPAVGCALLWLATPGVPLPWLVLAVALAGVGAGAEFDLSAFLVAHYFGLRDYGRLFGLHLGLITLGAMLAPFLFAAMYQASGRYDFMLGYGIVACTLGPLLLLTLGRPSPGKGQAQGASHCAPAAG